VEFGTFSGGSALFFATVMRQIANPFKVFSVDVEAAQVVEKVRRDPDIALLTLSSTDPLVAARIAPLKTQYPGKIFAILDSDHTRRHVLAEMILLRPLLNAGDYMVVEDSNINGHPVLPLWGAGPYEAVTEYMKQFPSDYTVDREREAKFGFTFAPNGFLIRN
jgi:cephalosporin hydroxylase